MLDSLDPAKVLQDLGEDAILLCREKAGEFCHRRLVTAWLEESLGIEVPEWGYSPAQRPVEKAPEKKPESKPPTSPQALQMSLF